MPRERPRRKKRRSRARHLVLAIAAIVAVPLLAWSAVAFVSNDPASTTHGAHDEPPSGGANSPTVTVPTPATTSSEPATDAENAISSCAKRIDAAEAAVTEADTGVGHWVEHIQARTDLLVGRNTQEDTRAIWKRTRLAGAGDVERFAAAVATYNEQPACDQPAAEAVPAELQPNVEACLDRASKTEAAVNAAAGTIGDWKNHLDAMVAHANGEMDATQAQTQWVKAWQNAPTNIEAFNDAQAALDQAPTCPGAGI